MSASSTRTTRTAYLAAIFIVAASIFFGVWHNDSTVEKWAIAAARTRVASLNDTHPFLAVDTPPYQFNSSPVLSAHLEIIHLASFRQRCNALLANEQFVSVWDRKDAHACRIWEQAKLAVEPLKVDDELKMYWTAWAESRNVTNPFDKRDTKLVVTLSSILLLSLVGLFTLAKAGLVVCEEVASSIAL
ncbi:hypothetical protein JCM9279_006354 [Rhodotorula babjevae]